MKEQKKTICILTLSILILMVFMLICYYCKLSFKNDFLGYIELVLQGVFTGLLVSLVISIITYYQRKAAVLNNINEFTLNTMIKISQGYETFKGWGAKIEPTNKIIKTDVGNIISGLDVLLKYINFMSFNNFKYTPFNHDNKWGIIESRLDEIVSSNNAIYNSINKAKLILSSIKMNLETSESANQDELKLFIELLQNIHKSVDDLLKSCDKLNKYLEENYKFVYPWSRIAICFKKMEDTIAHFEKFNQHIKGADNH